MDPLVLLSLITSVSSMFVSILTHIRYSKCGFCEVETKEAKDNPETIRSRSNSNSSRDKGHHNINDLPDLFEAQPLLKK